MLGWISRTEHNKDYLHRDDCCVYAASVFDIWSFYIHFRKFSLNLEFFAWHFRKFFTVKPFSIYSNKTYEMAVKSDFLHTWKKSYRVCDRLDFQPLFGKMSPRSSPRTLFGKERRPGPIERRKSSPGLWLVVRYFSRVKKIVWPMGLLLIKGRTIFIQSVCNV